MKKKGFTLIEVALFLAITGVLFMAIVLGTQNSVRQQRYYDSVQNYAEFLRSMYSEVSNPQSVGSGRGEYAIYGKLITFGESFGLDGKRVVDYDGKPVNDDGRPVFVYDVIGNVSGQGSGTAKALLDDRDANVIMGIYENNVLTGVMQAGEARQYLTRWSAEIETTDKAAFTGSILIVRNPRSGTINTLISKNIIQVNEMVRDVNEGAVINNERWKNLLKSTLDSFDTEEVDFCINPYGYGVEADDRWDVRLIKNARNASGVEIIDLDSDENRCR